MQKAKASPKKKLAAPDFSGDVRCLAGQALLDDMAAYRKQVTATPKAAREFLIRLGVLTTDGKQKRLIRG